ncbi:hypothetical protein [Curtobacterium sp. MCJR17_043]|uniref:hypothetical protein n=1 Tax=Curtobacterium sp. MCJR17_043 TaxID=2175660 RepID=UPI0024DFED9D|nr:hypothetical protein [Curtobacterium sp. MCJR17_043]WIB35028.1 hypothetical protein DEJ15_11175 [Curtobacterium sp. MCJR17_043]
MTSASSDRTSPSPASTVAGPPWGALRITGSTSVAWESVDRVVGATTVDGATAGRAVQTSGNRPLVGYDGRDVLVSLRHVRDLRRALVMCRGAGASRRGPARRHDPGRRPRRRGHHGDPGALRHRR